VIKSSVCFCAQKIASREAIFWLIIRALAKNEDERSSLPGKNFEKIIPLKREPSEARRSVKMNKVHRLREPSEARRSVEMKQKFH
jgi:hypothetical protein